MINWSARDEPPPDPRDGMEDYCANCLVRLPDDCPEGTPLFEGFCSDKCQKEFRILEAIEGLGEPTASEIVGATELPLNDVEWILSDLVESKRIKNRPCNTYTLSPPKV